MKKKLLTIIISLAAVLCLCFGTSACDNKTVVPDDGSHAEQGGVQGGSQDNNENDDNNNNKITFTVSFDTLGGSDVDPVSVSDGSKVKKPVEPSKEGYTFVEWQFEGQSWNFNRTIIKSRKCLVGKKLSN